MPADFTLDILPQPTDETCGPACLHAVYGFHGDALPLPRVIDEVPRLGTGGTLAPYLGTHALVRGYEATIYTYNLEMFDPTWFDEDPGDIRARLLEQARAKASRRLQTATDAYVEYLDRGGVVRFEELTPDLVRSALATGRPMMTGLSATYLYQCARERYDSDGKASYDPIHGSPTGHFVVLHGYDASTDSVLVADPYPENPLAGTHYYRVGIIRLLGAIMLGVLTYDGNLLLVEPRDTV